MPEHANPLYRDYDSIEEVDATKHACLDAEASAEFLPCTTCGFPGTDFGLPDEVTTAWANDPDDEVWNAPGPDKDLVTDLFWEVVYTGWSPGDSVKMRRIIIEHTAAREGIYDR